MIAKDINLSAENLIAGSEEEFSIPIDISDIILICQEYNKLGWQIQSQIAFILENGVEESIKTGIVKNESLPLIKGFLKQITNNAYFGDATSQAQECIELIKQYEQPPKQYHVN